jgi:hypothetical protein
MAVGLYLSEERECLTARLYELVEELQRDYPAEHARLRHQIAEVTVDLDYVRRRRFMSFRLGRRAHPGP